jgi:hypothetical protein
MIARAIFNSARECQIDVPQAQEFQALPVRCPQGQ